MPTVRLLFLIAIGWPVAAFAQDTAAVKEQRLREVVVSAGSAQRRLRDTQIGVEQVQVKELAGLPALFGENDILRSLQLLPGVKAESDASSSFQVRGGTSSQNEIRYDEAPVYNIGHLGGLVSAFNDEALARAVLYKGLLPAQYGGAAASVFDIASKAGDKKAWRGGATIGLLSAKGRIEGPLAGNNKASLLLCARSSYIGWMMRQIDDFKDNILHFYDLNAKVDYTLNRRNQFFFSFFTGRDRIGINGLIDVRWRNLTGSLLWLHHLRSEASHVQTSLTYSDYTTSNGMTVLGMNVAFSGHIRQAAFRHNWHVAGKHCEMDIGGQATLYDVKSAEWHNVDNHEREQRRAAEGIVWCNGEWRLSSRLKASAGLRLNAFSALGGALYYDLDDAGNILRLYNPPASEIVKTHLNVEPRLSIAYQAAPCLALKAGYSRTVQHLHALRNQNTSTPFDRYAMSSNILRPQVAGQVSAGLFASTPSSAYDFSVEAYYRHIDNVPDYRDGKSFSSEIEIERLVLAGQGRAYGTEWLARKNSGRLTGWIAYTLSWSKSKVPGINHGRWYTAGNDRRHDIDIAAKYRLSPRWTLHATWMFNTGQAFTAPSGKYVLEDNYIYYYAERNGYRAPAYHRMDVGAAWSRPAKRGGKREIVIGIYNVYNHYNPYLIRFEDGSDGARTRAVQYSLFGILPSVAYHVEF